MLSHFQTQLRFVLSVDKNFQNCSITRNNYILRIKASLSYSSPIIAHVMHTLVWVRGSAAELLRNPGQTVATPAQSGHSCTLRAYLRRATCAQAVGRRLRRRPAIIVAVIEKFLRWRRG